MSLRTYFVDSIRVYRPTPKVAAQNPERLYTVAGTFYDTETNAKGVVIPTDAKSFVSKNITRDMALAEGFSIDIPNGLLTLSEATRGRTSYQSLSAEDILADLAALRDVPEDDDDNDPAE